MLILLYVALFTLIGIALGIITGLVPGIHVNTVAIMIMVFSPSLLAFASAISPEDAVILVSAIIVGNLITHTFLDFIPSALFGAPDEDMALSVLPAHRMILRGEGMNAIRLSAGGSLHAVLIALILLFPAYIFFGPLHGYERLEPYIPYILALVVSVLIAEESRKSRVHSLYALAIFLFSGAFGWIVLNGSLFSSSPMIFEEMRESAPIFSGLLGLFGLPALIQSLGVADSIRASGKGGNKKHAELHNSFLGTISGAFVGWFPGVTSASATVMAANLSESSDEEGFITMMSAVNTSNAVFVILALFVIGRARSGALKVVQSLVSPELWTSPLSPPPYIFLLLFSVSIASAISYPLTLFFGSFFLHRMEEMEYRKSSLAIIAVLILICLALSGPVGLYVAVIGTMIGIIPPLIGISRVHLMGFLILPTIFYFLGVGL